MAFATNDRYGGRDRYGDDADIPAVVNDLLEQLETEQFEEPDNEHAEVSVSFGNWAISVHVSGLVCLEDLSWIGPGGHLGQPIPPLCRRAATRDGVANMLGMLARGEVDRLRAEPGWRARNDLPRPPAADFFRQPKAPHDQH